MLRTRSLLAAVVAAALLPVGPGVATLAAEPIVTLRLATAEDEGRPSEPFLQAFKSEVEAASAGSMTVDILYHAGGDDPLPKDAIAARRVLSGDVDMAVIPVRAWSDAGVTSFQAFAAPFLIDDDALAIAATSDPLVEPMIADAASHGVVALGIWPEDLRHPFTFEQNGPPLLRPDDFVGTNFWVLPYVLQTEAVEALGATVVHGFVDDQIGSLRGAETGLWVGAYNLGGGMPTATGDVTLYPKIQVLVADDAAWSRLSTEQQGIVRDAAISARATYLAQRPDDIADGAAYCAAGGRVVHAGAANIAAFLSAEAPIYERLAQDPIAAPAVAAIQALKDTITPTGPAATCEPAAGTLATIPPVEPGPATTLVPDGTYVHSVTKEDLSALGTGDTFAGNNAGQWTIVFTGETGQWTLKHPIGQVETCDLRFTLPGGDRVRMENQGPCGPYWTEFRWSLDGDQLKVTAVDEQAGTAIELLRTNAWLSGPWTKVE